MVSWSAGSKTIGSRQSRILSAISGVLKISRGEVEVAVETTSTCTSRSGAAGVGSSEDPRFSIVGVVVIFELVGQFKPTQEFRAKGKKTDKTLIFAHCSDCLTHL